MNFDNLKVAIHLNETEQPSLTMAFYMIQNLIKDMETEAGMKFKDIDMGNTEEFPILLAGQCRMIKSVYKSSSDELVRNRDRLEQLNGELIDIQKRLDEDADIGKQILKREKEHQLLQQQWEKLLLDKKEYEQIDQVCRKLESDIRKMENIDIRQRKKEEEELNGQYQGYVKEQRELMEKISDLQKAIEKLNADNSTLINDLTEKQRIYTELDGKKKSYSDSLSDIDKKLPTLKREVDEKQTTLSARTVEKDNLEKTKAVLDSKITAKQEEYNQYYHENIEPLQRECSILEEKIAGQENEKKRLTDTQNELHNRHQKLLSDIAKLPDNIRQLQNDISGMNSQYTVFESQRNDFQKKYKKLSEQVAQIQSETITLSKNDIPRVEELLRIATIDNNDKHEKLNRINQNIEDTKKETLAIEQFVQESTALLMQKKRELSDLRTKYDINSEEIAKLEKQLDELKGRTSKEKVEMLRNQLTADVEELKKLEKEYSELTKQCRKKERDIQTEKETVDKLRENKEDYEHQLEECRYATERLQRFQTKEFQAEFERVRDKVNFTYDIKSKMEHASEKLNRIVGKEKFRIGREWEGIFDYLQIINDYINDMQKKVLEETKKFFASENNF